LVIFSHDIIASFDLGHLHHLFSLIFFFFFGCLGNPFNGLGVTLGLATFNPEQPTITIL